MALSAGARIGPYEVIAPIGARAAGPNPRGGGQVVQFDLPMSLLLRSPASLSPDGQFVAYLQAATGGRRGLWLRDLGKPAADQLGNVPDGTALVWARDSSSLFAGQPDALRRVEMRTRASVTQPWGKSLAPPPVSAPLAVS